MTVSVRKREAIARAALTLFASDGYERTSINPIAAEAGVSKRTGADLGDRGAERLGP
jgi:TetR/AcrR family transcriptional repressor of mexJK operon